MQRFNHNIEYVGETRIYFKNRAMQLRYSGYVADPNITSYIVEGKIVGAVCKFTSKTNKVWHSLYILFHHRKKGHYKRWIENNPDKWIITTPDCEIYGAVSDMTNRVYEALGFSDNPGYQAIKDYYGDQMAKRADVFYMQHIDEGLVVLDEIFSSWQAKTAFCIHPLCQNDIDLFINTSNCTMERFEKYTIMLAMEYRSVANNFLSPMEDHPGYKDHTKIKLSPLSEVNQMLVADKVQNYKNFIEHYKDIHPRSEQLTLYFEQWFKALAHCGYYDDLHACISTQKFQVIT